MNAWNTLPLPPAKKEDPLWLRTQRRLHRMETWSMQHRLISTGSCERIQLQDERIALACRHLVLLLKEMEEGGGAKMGLTPPLD